MNESKVVPITFPSKVVKALRLAAADEPTSMAAIVRKAVSIHLANHYNRIWREHVLGLDD